MSTPKKSTGKHVTFASDDLSDVGSSCSQVLEDDVVKGIGALACSFCMELKTMARRFLDDPVLINMIGGEVNRGLLQRLIDEDDGEEDQASDVAFEEPFTQMAAEDESEEEPSWLGVVEEALSGLDTVIDEAAVNQAEGKQKKKGPRPTRKRKGRRTEHGVQEQNQEKDAALNQEEAEGKQKKGPRTTRKKKRRRTEREVQEQNQEMMAVGQRH